MATKMVSVRLDEELVAWADSYAEQRGVKRSRVIEAAVEAFRTDAQGGVPDLESASGRVSSGTHPGPATVQARGRAVPAAQPSAPTRDPRSRVPPNIPGVMTARELVMRQRQERVNRGGGS